MTMPTKKQLEMQERELRILEIARSMLVNESYHKLNMDRISEMIGVSKGTVYNHFGCKEEMILALANQTMKIRSDMFEQASLYKGLPRERLYGVGMAAERFVRLYPDHFKFEHLLRTNSIWEKTSEERRQMLTGCEHRCVSIIGGIIRDGIAQGHLQLPDSVSPEDIVFALWSINVGAFTIMLTSTSLPDLGIANPLSALQAGMDKMLDGYNFYPLSTEHDYAKVREQIQRKVFHDD